MGNNSESPIRPNGTYGIVFAKSRLTKREEPKLAEPSEIVFYGLKKYDISNVEEKLGPLINQRIESEEFRDGDTTPIRRSGILRREVDNLGAHYYIEQAHSREYLNGRITSYTRNFRRIVIRRRIARAA